MKRHIGKYGKSGELYRYTPETKIAKGVILFLPGLGEIADRGPLSIVERHEIPKLLRRVDAKSGDVINPSGYEGDHEIIVPQLNGDSWNRSVFRSLFAYLDSLGYEEKHLTGLSLGGNGTIGGAKHAYEWNGNKPGYFKSYGIVCGWTGQTPDIKLFEGSIVKWWHGLADNTITFEKSDADKFISALAGAGINAELKTYTGVDHNVWVHAYKPEEYFKFIDGAGTPVTEEPQEPHVIDEPVSIVKNADGLFVITEEGRFKMNCTLTKL